MCGRFAKYMTAEERASIREYEVRSIEEWRPGGGNAARARFRTMMVAATAQMPMTPAGNWIVASGPRRPLTASISRRLTWWK